MHMILVISHFLYYIYVLIWAGLLYDGGSQNGVGDPLRHSQRVHKWWKPHPTLIKAI